MVERKSINTLFFSYDGMTDPLGQSQVLPYIERLTKQGYQVTLISFEKDERKARRPFIEQLTKKAGIDWHPIRYTKGLPVLGAMWNVRKLRKLALQLHQEKNFKLVHCRSLLPAIVALELKQKYGVKFLFDMRGFWADERVDGKVWNLSNPLFKSVYKYFKHKEKEALQQADHVISLTHNGKKVIEEWGYGKAPISVIPCCVDLALFHATEEHPQQQRTNELVIGYLGAIGTWYMLPEMMDFFQRLLLKYPNACFHFITREDPEVIYREAAQRNIPKQHFKVEAANREDIPQKLLTWDFSIFFIKPVFSKRASSPTKQGEIMAMGIPIICNSGVGDTDYVINQYQAGALVHNFDHKSYDEIIEELEEIRQIPKENIRKGAEEFYSLEKGAATFQMAYQQALQN